jgi:hypothetical protein
LPKNINWLTLSVLFLLSYLHCKKTFNCNYQNKQITSCKSVLYKSLLLSIALYLSGHFKSIWRVSLLMKLGVHFFCGRFVLVSWQALVSSLVITLDFISQSCSKSTHPFAGLQHMQQCQVNFHSNFAFLLWSKWMMHEKWSPQWGLNPRPLSHESTLLP